MLYKFVLSLLLTRSYLRVEFLFFIMSIWSEVVASQSVSRWWSVSLGYRHNLHAGSISGLSLDWKYMLSYYVLLYFWSMYSACVSIFRMYFDLFLIWWVIKELCVLILGSWYPFVFPFGCCIFFNLVFSYLPWYWCFSFFHMWSSCCTLFSSLFIALCTYMSLIQARVKCLTFKARVSRDLIFYVEWFYV